MKIEIFPFQLKFKSPIKTSRGEMATHDIRILFIHRHEKWGWGEAAPLPGLSIENVGEIDQWYQQYLENPGPISPEMLSHLPSLRFAFESALMMLNYPSQNYLPIPINGLVWMNEADTMLQEAFQKVKEGFQVIKFKVGALDFDAECNLLEQFRKRHSKFSTSIRLDANGSFFHDEALLKLNDLARFDVHSIEQPLSVKQEIYYPELCAKTPIPIALDESLILPKAHKTKWFKETGAQMMVLKPSLLGGFSETKDWLKTAEETGKPWWITSALESQIGLSAIAQFISPMQPSLPQGLGTGKLYVQNFPGAWETEQGFLIFRQPTPNTQIIKQFLNGY